MRVLAVGLVDEAKGLPVDAVAVGFFLGRVGLLVLAFELLPAPVIVHRSGEGHPGQSEEKKSLHCWKKNDDGNKCFFLRDFAE